ncbi:formylglycine-generating enzyme required for sulfatase activity [Saccharopolyspora erythraea NRRL 2338]|uniref:Serine/threonine kinase n=2 Tax=Saccharopolyspora erythraea TaxID=1836 RepID=A4FDN9_SACEN|nr:SUMF1/EgtB/PvdO family nonheme iron enzyme [Saccharopolyspora erythraea]EQD85710.1 serine/threonine protein kinase [Saccharopolyspora erythraea D]PFG95899.1 formylglycine-generating enzyme required for sulfatase activity [Saccharopolyspora erythraea NRRL 2338]QRK92471.1 SUMF1/EgtB/PvdO family nonheme iron enzyme [Saccharopolyspora erythraea]CAM02164.1 serine/threonine kinase [Saccharopolyspora erythraea NRRL 2338]
MSPRPVLRANPNTLSDREAMGLPDDLVERVAELPLAGHDDLLARAPGELAVLAEDAGQPFDRRYAAGTLLGLRGDPRIRFDDPAMVEVPAATVRLGLAPEDVGEVVRRWEHVGVLHSWIAKETPVHEARIERFRVMRYPVTNHEYRRFLVETGHPVLPRAWRFGAYPHHLSNHPVWTVSPEEAEAYARWLGERTGRPFRLLTEAEWEYAAGGGDGRTFPWGDEIGADHANTVEHGPLSTTPVGIYPAGASPFGVLDMAGNVEEFVADDYRPYPGGEHVLDDLADGGRYRVARGGSFTRFGDLARCRRRHGWYSREIYAMGFRLGESV